MQTFSENLDILVVEDNPADFFLLEQMLLSSQLKIRNIFSAPTIKEAIHILESTEISVVLLDLSLPDSFGIDSLKSIRTLIQRIPVIVLTGLADSETAFEALQQQAQDYLVKGEINTNLLIKSIEYSIERKKAEENILASEEKYRQMFYENPLPMWINDEHSLQILEVNDAAIEKYGYDRNEFLKLTLPDIQVSHAPLTFVPMTDVLREKVRTHVKKDGETILVEFTYYPVHHLGRIVMQAQVNDITENVRLQKELTLQRQQMIEAVLSAQEMERKTIGAELHDNINQVLTAVKLNLGLALEFQENASLIVKSKKNIEMVMEEIRKLSKQLILPGNLKELGLVQSIRDMMSEVLYSTGIAWEVIAKDVNEALLSEEQKLTLYRIVQEQLNNIIKHAEASLITISLQVSGKHAQLKIVDDGKGFDTSRKRKGIGLTNIINRAELFDGYVNIESMPGRGCSLEVVLNSRQPLSSQAILKNSFLEN